MEDLEVPRVIHLQKENLRRNGYKNVEEWLLDTSKNTYVGGRMCLFIHENNTVDLPPGFVKINN